MRLINYILQFFFIQIERCIEVRIDKYTVYSYDIVHDAGICSRGVGKRNKYRYYIIKFWIIPFTNKYVNKENKYIISNKKLIKV